MMSKLKNKLHYVKLSIMASVTPAILFCNALLVQAAETTDAVTGGNSVTQKVEKAGNSFWGTAKLLCRTATLVALLVCGAILIIGTKQMKEKVKENFYEIAIGVAIIYFAGDICEWFEELFG